MTILYFVIGIIVIVGLFVYLRYIVPLRPKESGFEYVHVNEDGTVSELDEENIEYLKTEFSPTDGARPYIKSYYSQLTPDKKIYGFILRNRVPKRIEIKPYKNPNELRTIAWIYLAVSIASETEPTDYKAISLIADGINHAVPTHREFQASITWLLSKGLVNKTGNKYSLTIKGREDYNNASSVTNTLLKTWDKLENKIKKDANKEFVILKKGK